MNKSKDFLRRIVEEDLKSGKYREVVTRFPPEPNGFPHIGHAKSITINFGIARDYNGHCNLRMDDTNPTTEDTKYVEALKDAVHWLGFDWGDRIYHTSDYFPKLYDYAVELIKMGKAYVDSLSEEEIREYRGTVTEPGRRSSYAERSVEENLDLFERMKKGEFEEGEEDATFIVEVDEPGTLVSVQLSSETEDVDFDLEAGIDLDNSMWSSFDLGSEDAMFFMAPVAGEYFVRVLSNDDVGDYGLLIETLGIAPPIAIDELIWNRIEGGDKDAYRLNIDDAGGFLTLALVGQDRMDLDLEYAHLDPQVYFHHDQDPRRHLLSEGELLGHWLGPNADGFYAALSLPAAGGRLRLDFEQCRWGLLDGLTGLEAGFTDMTRGEKRWLTGQLASERMLGLHWERAWREDSPVRMDTRLSVARVARGGEWSGGGWLLELELKARIGRLFEEGVW